MVSVLQILITSLVEAENYIRLDFGTSFTKIIYDDITNPTYICFAPCKFLVFDIGIANEVEWPVTNEEQTINIRKEVNSNFDVVFKLLLDSDGKSLNYKIKTLNLISSEPIMPRKGYYFNFYIDVPPELQKNGKITLAFKLNKTGILETNGNVYSGSGDMEIWRKGNIIIRKPESEEEAIYSSIKNAEINEFFGEYDNAQSILSTILAKYKDNNQALFLSGYWYMGQGEHKKASERLERLISLYKRDEVPDYLYESCSFSYYMSGNKVKAEEIYKKIKNMKKTFEIITNEWEEQEKNRKKDATKNKKGSDERMSE